MLPDKNQEYFNILYIILLFVVILREPEGNNMFIGLRINNVFTFLRKTVFNGFTRKQPT